jgi:molybdopterin synthase catalytic subunit
MSTRAAGAVCTFVGVVRATHKGRRVRHLEYEAFEPLAVKVFDRIDAEVRAEWPRASVGIHHRIGRLEIGEASVAIAASSAHRPEAFQVCRYAIERVKQVLPVWKHEFFEDGDAWVEGAVADLDDEAARVRAHEVACA